MPSDLTVTPVAALAASLRARLSFDDGGYALTLRNSRTLTRVVEANGVELLRQFEQPSTIAEAIIRFARARDSSPEVTLEEAYPLLEKLFENGFLVVDGSPNADGVRASARPGDRIARWEVVRAIQTYADSELYLAYHSKGFASLKIERPDVAQPFVAENLANEARILQALNGRCAPRLIESGTYQGRRFVASEWIAGAGADVYARECRIEEDRIALLALCREIAGAYVALHEAGFIHADVHQRNVLVDRGGKVWLVDFGSAVDFKEAAPAGKVQRDGLAFFFEPELAAALLEGRALPRPSAAGEQYAVAALMYRITSGAHYLDFSLERAALLRQILLEPPLPFAARELKPWAGLESVLAHALQKSPNDRYPSMEAFASAIERAGPPQARSRVRERPAEISKFFESLPERLESPSLFSGAAGVACALYRRALVENNAARLAAADLWLTRAEQNEAECEAAPSPFHGASGLAAMRALLANAQGDASGARRATRRFLRLAFGERTRLISADLTLGDSGALLAAALVGDALQSDAAERRDLASTGGELLDTLWSELGRRPPIALEASANLGMAHGWCGYAYAALRFCKTFGRPYPATLRNRVVELAELGEPHARGLRWRWESGSMPGWCNGSAGFVLLFVLAHRELGETRLLESAIGAAWNTWEGGNADGTLCCGLAGRAFALLALSAHLGNDAVWLTRARTLAARASEAALHENEEPFSLFKGRLGAALAAAELEHPQYARFPFLEDEGWR